MRYRKLSYRYTEVTARRGLQRLGDLWEISRQIFLAQREWRPAFDLYESDGSLSVKVELPGIAEENLEIVFYADALVISGTRPWEMADASALFHAVEIRYGPFHLEIPVLARVDWERVEIQYTSGFLQVRIPKKQESPP